jgi:hypothetical protein
LKHYAAIAFVLLLLQSILGCENAQQHDFTELREALIRDHELSVSLAHFKRPISLDESAQFMKENMQNRTSIIYAVENAKIKTEKGKLGKKSILNFLKMENKYCEAYIDHLDLVRQAFAVGRRGYMGIRSDNMYFRANSNAVRIANKIRQNLKASETEIEQYGWEKTWSQEDLLKTPINSSEKPSNPSKTQG